MRVVVFRVGPHQPDGHDRDVAIGRHGEGVGEMRERIRIANRHEDAARPRVDLFERERLRRDQVERVAFVSGRRQAPGRCRERRADTEQRGARGDAWGVAAGE